MENFAVYEGDERLLMNLTSDPRNVAWTLIPTADEFSSVVISSYSDQVDPSYAGLFYINQSGLFILHETTQPSAAGPASTSGLYIAQCANNENRTGAKLLVVRNGPVCSCNASSPDAIQLSCTIFYADATLNPINANMTWKNDDVFYTADTPARTRIDYFVFQSTSTITVDSSFSNNFTCTVAFNAPTDIAYDFIATNAPVFSASCSVEVCPYTTTISTTTTTLPLQTTTTHPPTTATTPPLTTILPPTTTTIPLTTQPSTTTTIPLTTQPLTTTTPATTTTTTQLQTTFTEILTTTEPYSTTSGYCIPNMRNIAVREGAHNILMNVTSSSCTVTWKVVSTSDELAPYTITSSGCTVDSNLQDLYYIYLTGLIIRDSTTTEDGHQIATAGLYIADCYSNGSLAGAKLVVVRSGPDCSCAPDTTSSSSSTDVELTCTAAYADGTVYPIHANMTWIVNGVYYTTDSPYMNKTDTYVFTITSTITVDGSTLVSYQCIMTFDEPMGDQYPYIAMNAPDFNESCSATVCVSANDQTAVTQTATTAIDPCMAHLENIAVYEGNLSTLFYFPANARSVKWTTTATTDELTEVVLVNYDDTVDPSYAADYAFDPSSGLTVKNATTSAQSGHQLSTAGLYTLECNHGNQFKVKLLVVRQGPTCSCNPSNSSSVQLSCSSIYGDSSYDPINAVFTLYVDGTSYATDTPARTSNGDTTYTYISTSTFTINNYASSSTYQCVHTFSQPTLTQGENIAMNAPTFKQNCSFSAVACSSSAQLLLGVPEDPPPPPTLKSQLVVGQDKRDPGLTTLEIILIVIFGFLLLTVLVFFIWCCRFCSGGKRLRRSQMKENMNTYGAWDYSYEGRERLPVPKNRSWTLSSYSFNTHPEQNDFRFPRSDPRLKFRYMRSMV